MTEDKLKQAIHQAIEQATVKIFGGLNGTGFFITADGYILTAYHCIRSEDDIREGYFPKKIRVQLISGEMLEVQLDQEKSVQANDIAVLKVNYSPESYLPLGTEAKIHDDVVALGYPAAYLYKSSPLGVYSGKISRFPTDTLIETDAVKGKGHSGSALYHYDSKRVIGVLSEVYEPQVMTNAGLVVRLEPLFAKWPELHHINQEVAEIWEQKLKILTEEVAKTWEKRKKTQLEVQLTPRELRNRRDLLSQIKGEVNSRLEQSLHNASFINIDKESQPQQVKPRLWDVEVKVVSQPNESYFLPRSKEIIDIFDDEPIAGKLLILGEPGSGKTTTLLELAKELVNRAENNPAEPLPILLNLSSWKGDKSVDQWIIEELKSKYGVHKKIGKEWVESGQLLPLLDGLDELESSRQEPMIKEVNRFLESDKRPLYLVICSRREEYELQKVQLQLNAAVCLQPLTEVQIRTYLRSAECLPLWESFQNDAALYELAKSPFFLSVIVLSAGEISHENWVQLNSSEERRQYLFEIYTKKMLSRNLKKRHYFRWFKPSVEETQHWLEELAIRLEREKESEFLVEKLQSREPAYRALFAISSILIATLIGLVTSFNQWYLPFSLGEYDNEPYKIFFMVLFMIVLNSQILIRDFLQNRFKNIQMGESLRAIIAIGLLLLPFVITWIFFSINSIESYISELIREYTNLIYWINFGLFINLLNYLNPPIRLFEKVKFSPNGVDGIRRAFYPLILVFAVLYIIGIFEAILTTLRMGNEEISTIKWIAEEPLANWVYSYAKMISNPLIFLFVGLLTILLTIFIFYRRENKNITANCNNIVSEVKTGYNNIVTDSQDTIVAIGQFIYFLFTMIIMPSFTVAFLVANPSTDERVSKVIKWLAELTNWIANLSIKDDNLKISDIGWITDWIYNLLEKVGMDNVGTILLWVWISLFFNRIIQGIIVVSLIPFTPFILLVQMLIAVLFGGTLVMFVGLFTLLFIMLIVFFIIRCTMPFYYLINCTFNKEGCLTFHNIFFPNLFAYGDDILFIYALVASAILYGIIGPIGPTVDIDNRKFPNQGIRNTLINAIIFLLIGGLFFGVASLRIYDKQTSTINGIIIGLLIGLFIGRAYLQHYVLRIILWLKGDAPFFYVKFLDYATERMFLQRVGGRYRFIHKLLQGHFARKQLVIEKLIKVLREYAKKLEQEQSVKNKLE